MDFSLSNEQRSWQMTARKFANEEIKPITLDLDRLDHTARDQVAAQLGFLDLPQRVADGRFRQEAHGSRSFAGRASAVGIVGGSRSTRRHMVERVPRRRPQASPSHDSPLAAQRADRQRGWVASMG